MVIDFISNAESAVLGGFIGWKRLCETLEHAAEFPTGMTPARFTITDRGITYTMTRKEQ